MEKKKMKSVASITANYVSILQLQERWLKEKERKQTENEMVDREVKQQQQKVVDDEQRKREQENRKKVVKSKEPKVNLEEYRNCGVNRWKKEPNFTEKEVGEVSATVSKKKEKKGYKNQDRSMEEAVKRERKVSPEDNPVKEELQRVCTPNAEPNCAEKEVGEVSATVSKKEEDGVKKKKCSKNNKFKRESKVSLQTEYIPVKEEIQRVYTAKEENADRDLVAVESGLQDLWIKKRVQEVKGPARLSYGQGNRRHDLSSTRVIRGTNTMVWMKKGNNGGNGV